MYDCKTYDTTTHHPGTNSDARGLEYLALVNAYFKDKDDIMADVLELASGHTCLLVMDTHRDDLTTWWYIHPSLRIDGFQLTRFDDCGPVSHYDITADARGAHELAHALPDNLECWYWVD